MMSGGSLEAALGNLVNGNIEEGNFGSSGDSGIF